MLTAHQDPPDQHVKAGELVVAHSSSGSHFHNDLQIEALVQIDFNEDELL
jgi:hypothetical protein